MAQEPDERFLAPADAAALGHAAFEGFVALLDCLLKKGTLSFDEVTEILLKARHRGPGLRIVEQRLNFAVHDLLVEPDDAEPSPSA